MARGAKGEDYMRARVVVKVDIGLLRGVPIVNDDNSRTWVAFRYERLPNFCHWCGRMGYIDSDGCRKGGKDGEEVKYGEWLRANSEARHPLNGKILDTFGREDKEQSVEPNQVQMRDSCVTERSKTDYVKILLPTSMLNSLDGRRNLWNEMHAWANGTPRSSLGAVLGGEDTLLGEHDDPACFHDMMEQPSWGPSLTNHPDDDGVEVGEGQDNNVKEGKGDESMDSEGAPGAEAGFIFTSKGHGKNVRSPPKRRPPSKQVLASPLVGIKRKLFTGEVRVIGKKGLKKIMKPSMADGLPSKRQKGGVQISELDMEMVDDALTHDDSISAAGGVVSHSRRKP